MNDIQSRFSSIQLQLNDIEKGLKAHDSAETNNFNMLIHLIEGISRTDVNNSSTVLTILLEEGAYDVAKMYVDFIAKALASPKADKKPKKQKDKKVEKYIDRPGAPVQNIVKPQANKDEKLI